MYDPGREAEVALQGGDVVSTYSQPGAGQDLPHATTQVAASDDGGQVGVSTFAYDAAGNMTARDVAGQAAQSLTWDREGELRAVSADGDGDGTVQADESDEYIYSADGNRLVRTQGGTTTVYLPGQELTITSGGVQATRYYTFAGRTVAMRTGGGYEGVTSIFADHHQTGSLQIANVANTVVRRLLDPFGAPRDAAAGDPTSSQGTSGWTGDRGFIDKPADATGLTAIGARYYDPLLGAFISVDPVMDLTDPQQWHAYTYSNANPTTWSDPSGPMYCGMAAKYCFTHQGKNGGVMEEREIVDGPYLWDSRNFPVAKATKIWKVGKPKISDSMEERIDDAKWYTSQGVLKYDGRVPKEVYGKDPIPPQKSPIDGNAEISLAGCAGGCVTLSGGWDSKYGGYGYFGWGFGPEIGASVTANAGSGIEPGLSSQLVGSASVYGPLTVNGARVLD